MADERDKAVQLEGLSVLLVDDNEPMRSVVRSMLKARGCQDIAEAQNGEDALKRLRVFPASVVICDWAMAPMDGLEFTRRIRGDTNHENRRVPIIILSGHADIDKIKAARDAGAHEFLAKPVRAEVLYERLRDIVHRPRKFIESGSYFGPDRHRKQNPKYRGPERRKQPRDPA